MQQLRTFEPRTWHVRALQDKSSDLRLSQGICSRFGAVMLLPNCYSRTAANSYVLKMECPGLGKNAFLGILHAKPFPCSWRHSCSTKDGGAGPLDFKSRQLHSACSRSRRGQNRGAQPSAPQGDRCSHLRKLRDAIMMASESVSLASCLVQKNNLDHCLLHLWFVHPATKLMPLKFGWSSARSLRQWHLQFW